MSRASIVGAELIASQTRHVVGGEVDPHTAAPPLRATGGDDADHEDGVGPLPLVVYEIPLAFGDCPGHHDHLER